MHAKFIYHRDHVHFLTIDLMDDSQKVHQQLTSFLSKDGRDKAEFDLVSVFSITMWIHLNHGDTGLEQFLDLVCSLGRHVLIEPQVGSYLAWNQL